MKKNTAIIVTIVAWDTILNTGKTGDHGNITLRGVGDGSEYTPAASAVEVDATNLPGVYSVSLTEAENNYDSNLIGGKSATANISIFGIAWINEEVDFGATEKASITAAVPSVVQVQDGLAPAGEYDTEMSRIDVDVSSRSTLTAAGVWDALLTGITTAASVGKLIKDYLDAAVSGRAPASEYDTEMARIDVAVSTRTKPADTQAKVTLVDTVTENTDMRGTDDGALATVCTEARLAELDAANLPADADSIKAVTDKVDNMIEAVE